MCWHIKLIFKGTEYPEDRPGAEAAKDWVTTTLAELGHTEPFEWKLVGDTWRAGFSPNLDVYITPRT